MATTRGNEMKDGKGLAEQWSLNSGGGWSLECKTGEDLLTDCSCGRKYAVRGGELRSLAQEWH